MGTSLHIGVDLGGTKIEAVALRSLRAEDQVARLRRATESDKGYEAILTNIKLLLEELYETIGHRPTHVGFGTPGVEDPQTKLMKNCNAQCMNGKPLRADLERALGISVRLANDANCFALAEATLGAARGAQSCFGVIMGTGVGGGIVIDGKLHPGAQGIGGEWGHNVLDPSGIPCYCGKAGCVETIIAGPALERFYQQLAGKKLKLHEIMAAANQGEAPAIATQERLLEMFGRAIAVVINILDPECVVLGGGVSNIQALYERGSQAAAPYVFNNRLETKIVKNQLGDSAGVFGAACLTISQLSNA